ncbi:RPAP1-like protein [Boeremia exigua]|uniref:RPAP1-like protein n=1 Tax=Boeremia exigua TaxID=749465 RepID=UPI001E8D4B5D|nr:RPAP1-like protein [Boeremia exigua]KAH6637617.1 RPAP1-like protein [Boeremia exigua]
MEFQKGERVFLNFETGGVEKTDQETQPEPSALPAFDFVGDILERDLSAAAPPVAPSLKSNTTGFPAHKKRTPRVSAFKQRRAANEQQPTTAPKAQDVSSLHSAPPPRARFDPDDERRAIDEENQARLDAMSEEEIEEERRELMANLDPALIQRLLNRPSNGAERNQQSHPLVKEPEEPVDTQQSDVESAIQRRLFESNIDDGSNEQQQWPEDKLEASQPVTFEQDTKREPTSKAPSSKKVAFAEQVDEEVATPRAEATPTEPTHTHGEEAAGSLHFAPTPQPPDLDPNDPNFLENLHTKYFPSLPYNPSTVEWMKPVDPTDKSSPYHPSQNALNASELRFDFKGTLLAPSVARELPTNQGLHHHADAPEAAGYTIPELAVTARSAVAAQRCVAYQTLGRILYRLGQGEFGVEQPKQETDGPVKIAKNPDMEEEEIAEDDDVGHYMAVGLWKCIEDGRVIETLTEEAGREKGHLTARTFAQEALWNWRRGGGRKRHAV